MPIPILMPALSPTMEEGKLAKWLVKEGDRVSSGDVIAEIETDKATMEVEAVDEGTVGRILIPEGTEKVAVNAPIAVLLEEGEDASALDKQASAPPKAAPASSKPNEPATPAAASGSKAAAPQTAPAATPQPAPPQQSGQQPAPAKANGRTATMDGHGQRVFASPLARRVAEEKGIGITALHGSGPHGRIVLRDVEKAAVEGVPAKRPVAQQPAQALVPSQGRAIAPSAIPDEQILALFDKGSYDVVPHDNMRRTIATRLVQAKSTIPHFYLTVDCELDKLLDARQRLNVRAPKDGPNAYRLSVNDFIIKAMGLALKRVPKANATWTEGGMLYHKHADVAVAVAIEGGLFTPVLRSVEDKTLAEISIEMKDLAERARKKRLAPHEYQGGTTAISNLGMYGVKNFDAVINPPHASILAVGEGEKRPVVSNDQIAIVTLMSATLSCDHRVVDGALGAQLLSAFKGFIEEPITMLV
jgi:pyruvate dehydrogenase E2 component (dihydrolipoamide acetyltransferase)